MFFRDSKTLPVARSESSEYEQVDTDIPHSHSRKAQIPNLSSRTLTDTEMSILLNDLSFVPSARFNKFYWTQDIHLFARKLKWQKYHCQRKKRECLELGIPEYMLYDVKFLFNLGDSNNEMGKGLFTTLKPQNRKISHQGDISCIGVFVEGVMRDFIKIPNFYSPNCKQRRTSSTQQL